MTAEVGYRNYEAHNARFNTGLTVFQVLLEQGLTSDSRLCDVGCGSLRVGRYLITHLEHGLYYAIEPQQWLIDNAIEHEIGTLAIVKEAHIDVGREDFDIAASFPGVEFDFVLIASVLAHASHDQMRQALTSASQTSKVCVFDTVPNGSPDNTGGWQYPQVASHYDECVLAACDGLSKQLTKLALGQFGEQWWRLE